MSTRRQRELLLSGDQAKLISNTLMESVARIVKAFRTHRIEYEGYKQDRLVAIQVLNAIVPEIKHDLDKTLAQITRYPRRNIP